MCVRPTQAQLIGALNPIIVGWCQYYRSAVSKASFASLSAQLFHQLLRWAKRRHPNLNSHQAVSRYWRTQQNSNWVFQTPEGLTLYRHDATPIRRHVKVRANRSPYDGDWVYWGKRLGHYPELAPLKAALLKRQNGTCAHCGLYFSPDDLVEIHHLDGNHDNQRQNNLALLHRHCHDQVHAVKVPP